MSLFAQTCILGVNAFRENQISMRTEHDRVLRYNCISFLVGFKVE